jgi:hypothetical protein
VVLNECVENRIIAEQETESIDKELAIDDLASISVNAKAQL